MDLPKGLPLRVMMILISPERVTNALNILQVHELREPFPMSSTVKKALLALRHVHRRPSAASAVILGVAATLP